MHLDDKQIAQIVETVLSRLERNESRTGRSRHPQGIFETLDEAVEAARQAQKKIRKLELRAKIIQAIRQAGVKHARELAEMAVQETGMGRVEDKIAKNV